jgi:hypothetical protein
MDQSTGGEKRRGKKSRKMAEDIYIGHGKDGRKDR